MLAHRTPRALVVAALLTAGLHLSSTASAFAPLTSAFTYQGEIAWNGTASSATVDLRFRLFDDLAAGAQVGVTVEKLTTTLVDGRFTTDLDFGSSAFDGNERYLEIAVRSPAGVGAYVTLNPRQRLAAGPNSIYSTKAATATNALALNGQAAAFYRDAANLNAGTIPDARLATSVARTNTNQTFTGAMNFSNAGNAFSGAFAGNGSALSSLNASNITSGTIVDSLLSSNVAFKNAANVFTNTNVFNGFVGIGGAAPATPETAFQVNKVTGPSVYGGMYINTSDAAGWPFYGYATAGVFRLWHAYDDSSGTWFLRNVSGERLTSTSNGFLGVAGVTPTQALDVNGNIRSRGVDFILNGRGGGVGNNANAGRALVDAGLNSIAGTGLIINYGNDFGGVWIGSDAYTEGRALVGTGVASPELRLGNDGTLPVGLTKEENALINLDLNFRGSGLVQATRGAALRLDSRVDQPSFNFFARSAASPTERLVMSIQDSGFVGINQLFPIGSARFGVTAPTTGNQYGGMEVGTSSADGRPYLGFHTGGIQRAWIEYVQASNTMNVVTGGLTRQSINFSGANTYFGQFGNVGINCLGANTAELEVRGGAPGGNFNADVLLRPSLNGGGAQKAISFAAATDGNAVTNPTLYIGHYDGFGAYSDRLIINANGSVQVTGALSKGGGSFKIDHPLDPENKYLYHSFVESPDMMNVYNGNITTDANGYATITLPDYFEALNKDFRYQLTIVDENDTAWSFAKVVQKVHNNTFVIRTSAPEIEVSWQITGIRKDNWAEQNRIPNAVDKEPENKGKYLHPEAFGQPVEKGITHRKDTEHATPAVITDDKPRVMELNPAPHEVSQK